MTEAQIVTMLERLGKTLSEADPVGAAHCWSVPALVLGEDNALAVSNHAEIENFFAGAIEAYRARGIFITKPDVKKIEMLSPSLAAVEVCWPGYDEAGKEVESARECSHYLVQAGEGEDVFVKVALSRIL